MPLVGPTTFTGRLGTPTSVLAGILLANPGAPPGPHPGFIADASAVFDPAILPGPVTVVPGFIADSSAVYAPQVSGVQSVPVGFIADTAALYAPSTILKYPVAFIGSSEQVYSPTLKATQVTHPGFIGAASVVYPPTLGVGPLRPPPVRRVGVVVTAAPLGRAGPELLDFPTFADVMSVRIRFGFDQRVAEASIVTSTQPAGVNFDDRLSLALGSPEGAGTINRFIGYVRDFRFSENPPTCETVLKGSLIRAQEYENFESTTVGDAGGTPIPGIGLLIPDLAGGAPTADSATIVQAALDRAGVDTNSGIIAGSDVQYGALAPFEFEWHRAPLDPSNQYAQEAGESALSYIERYDLVDAQLTGDGTSGGRYRIFDTAGGQVFRIPIGGVPEAAAEFVFEEGIDILDGQFTRSIDNLRNYFVVHGYDPGNNFGGIRYELVADNGIQTGSHTQTFSSAMIERFNEEDTLFLSGMSAERVAKALAFEQNVLTGWITTWREDLFGIGQTHLVRGPGGLVGRMGISSELVWVQSLELTFDESGFTQRIGYVGGLST